MEKCSFCIQRINSATREAKRTGNEEFINTLQPACAQACPTDALVFGNLNNANSQVSILFQNEREYTLQESLGTEPNIRYLKKVDKEASSEAVHA